METLGPAISSFIEKLSFHCWDLSTLLCAEVHEVAAYHIVLQLTPKHTLNHNTGFQGEEL